MKKINLTNGGFALVDDKDYDFINQWKWYAHKKKRTSYATRNKYLGKQSNGGYKCTTVLMHRVLLNAVKEMEVDHKDHNGLNNQRKNLRTVKPDQNRINRSKTTTKVTSKYKGVSRINSKSKNKWRAVLNINKKIIHIGCYPTQKKAAIAYNKSAKKHHGNFASINKI
jgi:hypothetical protein